MTIALVYPKRGHLATLLGGRPWGPPGGLLEVAAMTPSEHRVVLWDELARGPIFGDDLSGADLCGISGLSTSRYGAFRVAKLAHELGIPVVAGGMDVTGLALEGHQDELFEHYDAIVVGRLTRPLWQQVLGDCQAGRMAGVYQADPGEPWEFPVPRHDLVNPKDYYLPIFVRTSAGCREKCPFCTVGLMTGDNVFHKPREVLQQELELVNQHFPKDLPMVLSDDSFGNDFGWTVESTLPLLRASGRPWLTEMTIKNFLGQKDVRPELAGPMAQAGCFGAYFGIENIFDPVSGKSVDRKTAEMAIKRAHQLGMMVLGSFVLDLTGRETRQSIRETVHWISDQHLEFIQLSLLALLPGSASRRLALSRGRVIDNNPEHLDGAWPTISHLLSPEERLELLAWAYQKLYSWWGVLSRLPMGKHYLFGLAASLKINRSIAAWPWKEAHKYWLQTREPVT